MRFSKFLLLQMFLPPPRETQPISCCHWLEGRNVPMPLQCWERGVEPPRKQTLLAASLSPQPSCQRAKYLMAAKLLLSFPLFCPSLGLEVWAWRGLSTAPHLACSPWHTNPFLSGGSCSCLPPAHTMTMRRGQVWGCQGTFWPQCWQTWGHQACRAKHQSEGLNEDESTDARSPFGDCASSLSKKRWPHFTHRMDAAHLALAQ